MKTVIYIRHGPDERRDHKYDEHLTKEGIEDVKRFTEELIEKHGLPDVIYYTPFYRGRQTRKVMMKTIKKLNLDHKNIELILEPKLGRWFTYKQSQRPDIKSSTFRKGAITDETKEEFKERVKEQLEEVLNNGYKNVWNITNTLVLLRVARIKNIVRDKYVKYLDTVVLTV